MCDPVSAGIGLVAAGVGAWSAKEQSDAAKEAQKAQEAAAKKQEEELRKQGPTAKQISESAADTMAEERLRRLRGGMMGNLKAGNLTAKASTAATGLKAKMGD